MSKLKYNFVDIRYIIIAFVKWRSPVGLRHVFLKTFINILFSHFYQYYSGGRRQRIRSLQNAAKETRKGETRNHHVILLLPVFLNNFSGGNDIGAVLAIIELITNFKFDDLLINDDKTIFFHTF